MCMNWILTERACNMKLQANMSEYFLVEAVSRVSYLVNMLPSMMLIFRSQKNMARRVNGLFNLMDIRESTLRGG